MEFFKKLYLNNLFFYVLIGIIAGFVLAYFFPSLYRVCWLLVIILVAFLSIDILLLFGTKQFVKASRQMPKNSPTAMKTRSRLNSKISIRLPFLLK